MCSHTYLQKINEKKFPMTENLRLNENTKLAHSNVTLELEIMV
jgi:hypothetical protein